MKRKFCTIGKWVWATEVWYKKTSVRYAKALRDWEKIHPIIDADVNLFKLRKRDQVNMGIEFEFNEPFPVKQYYILLYAIYFSIDSAKVTVNFLSITNVDVIETMVGK